MMADVPREDAYPIIATVFVLKRIAAAHPGPH
jgi:hypothetical protein